MQDIDFGKINSLKKPKDTYNGYLKGHSASTYKNHKNKDHDFAMKNIRRITMCVFILILGFILGLLSGIHIAGKDINKNGSGIPTDFQLEDLTLKNTNPQKNYPKKAGKTDTKDKENKIYQDKKQLSVTKQEKQEETNTISQNIASNVPYIRVPNSEKQSEKKVYLIWAKTYGNRIIAYRHGHFLKKQDFPVFLAKNGDKIKLYIGPLYGEKKAYEVLGQIKKWPPFQGAILHQKKK